MQSPKRKKQTATQGRKNTLLIPFSRLDPNQSDVNRKTVTNFCEFPCFFVEIEGRQAGGEREGEEKRKEHGSPWTQTLQGCGKKGTESLSFLYYANRSLHSRSLLNLFLKCKLKSY